MLSCTRYFCFIYVATFDYAKFIAFIDIFDDVNKLELDDVEYDMTFTLTENIIFVIYSEYYKGNLTDGHKMKVLFRLLQRGFSECEFDDFLCT